MSHIQILGQLFLGHAGCPALTGDKGGKILPVKGVFFGGTDHG